VYCESPCRDARGSNRAAESRPRRVDPPIVPPGWKRADVRPDLIEGQPGRSPIPRYCIARTHALRRERALRSRSRPQARSFLDLPGRPGECCGASPPHVSHESGPRPRDFANEGAEEGAARSAALHGVREPPCGRGGPDGGVCTAVTRWGRARAPLWPRMRAHTTRSSSRSIADRGGAAGAALEPIEVRAALIAASSSSCASFRAVEAFSTFFRRKNSSCRGRKVREGGGGGASPSCRPM
jgi:hypothetical protein